MDGVVHIWITQNALYEGITEGDGRIWKNRPEKIDLIGTRCFVTLTKPDWHLSRLDAENYMRTIFDRKIAIAERYLRILKFSRKRYE